MNSSEKISVTVLHLETFMLRPIPWTYTLGVNIQLFDQICTNKSNCKEIDYSQHNYHRISYKVRIDTDWFNTFPSPSSISSINGEEIQFNDCDCKYNSFSCDLSCTKDDVWDSSKVYDLYSDKNINYITGPHKKAVLESNDILTNGIFGLKLNTVKVISADYSKDTNDFANNLFLVYIIYLFY